jgi:MerC mercury resistance protein
VAKAAALCASPRCNDPKCYVDGSGRDLYEDEVPDLLYCSFIESSSAASSPASSFSSGMTAKSGPATAEREDSERATDDEASPSAGLPAPATTSTSPLAASRLSYPAGLATRSGVLPAPTTAARRRGGGGPGRPISFGSGKQNDPVVVLYQRGRPPRTRNNQQLQLVELEKSPSTSTERLLQLSNVASMLCVVDCTVLPLATIGLSVASSMAGAATAFGAESPLASWIGGVSPLLHEWGHLAALYFVVPVGVLASTVNYSVHRSRRIAAVSIVGLLLVILANAGCGHGFVHALEALLPHSWGHAAHRALHAAHHHAVLHRVVNLMGCAFLLFGNHLSRQHSACASANCRC